jgi:hypothetical protein
MMQSPELVAKWYNVEGPMTDLHQLFDPDTEGLESTVNMEDAGLGPMPGEEQQDTMKELDGLVVNKIIQIRGDN